MNKPMSKAGQRLANMIKGLDALADSLGLFWFMDDHGTQNIYFYIADKKTRKRLHGPVNDFAALEEELNSLYLATGQKQS